MVNTPEVTEYIDKIKLDWQAEVCKQIRATISQVVPDAEEKIQYGKPHYRRNGKYLCVIGTAKGWVSFTIFNATSLETPAGMFESSDTGDRKTIKLLEGQSVDSDLLGKLLKQAAATL
ncbi:MAG: DUF1801 domain-containing protein [Chloroflexi bacterium]|nr:DUF1801 domain-containing protein [Chloroflexota bacterium]